jgi:hypothetical protein
MPTETKEHKVKLEAKIKELQEIFDDFGDAKKHLATLLKIIHNPGWTTIAEWAFVESILNAEKSYAQPTLRLNSPFLAAASKVELNPQPLPP